MGFLAGYCVGFFLFLSLSCGKLIHTMKVKDDGFNANFLRSLRKEAGLSQTALANKVGVELRTVQYWEAGTKSPGQDNRRKLEEVFDIPSFMLLHDAGQIAYANLSIALLRQDDNILYQQFLLDVAQKLKAVGTERKGREELSLHIVQTINDVIGEE